jgi:hypothetical protein
VRRKATIIADGWKEYRTQVISPDAPEVQLIECKRAFFAGARSLMSSMQALIDLNEEPTEDQMLMLDDIEDEMARYAQDVLTGRE